MRTAIDEERSSTVSTEEIAESTSGTWLVVARRELLVKLGDKTFLAGSALMLALIVGIIGIQAWVDGRTSTYDVAVSSAGAGEMVDAIAVEASDLDEDVEVEPVVLDSDDAARDAVSDEEVDAWLRADADGGWTLVTRDEVDGGLQRVVTDVVATEALEQNAADAGTTVTELRAGSEVQLEQLDGDAELSQLRDILGFAFAFLFYIASIMFGTMLASSVVEEKQSRIVEMIAAAVPLRQLLAGKIIGNTVLALVQMVIYVGVGMVGLSFTGYGDLVPMLTGEAAWFLAFFVVGFLALACLWSVAGALAGRNEDLQSTATPVTMLLLAIFLGSAFLDGRWEVIGSYVPPLSAVAMPMRLVGGTAAWWEAVIALGLLVGFAALLVLLAERVYRRALLQTGGKLTMRQAWRIEE